MLKILFLGDIVGKPGRKAVQEKIAGLRSELGLDFVIANAENSAAGAGLTAAIANELAAAGVDAMTLGDHCWDQRGFDAEITQLERVCRPANLPEQCPGRSWLVLEKEGVKLGVITLLGHQFMKIRAHDPFYWWQREWAEVRKQADVWLVEMHAEATSEKLALGWYLDGQVAAVLGSHTHVPTADARLLPRGTAYLTDLGMTGPYASVLGRSVQASVARFLDGMPRRLEVAEDDVRLCGALLEVDPASGAAVSIERFELQV
jgi:2',3'-cyclic-nucleotide 2'-phosphodiesterase